ncbi:unnamed protein product [Macrosiphum euphorbiae]|uniref:Uncharacterized protein n=1 Tax=Macrosiphum euphorbiae TaxID=13131 RepID=A0AAV0XV34_9HEMI|nr:unnamed protein product [Macrosiphum euphorbiae]
MIVENTQFSLNPRKGMYEVIWDLVNLLTHKNLDFLAAVCHLIVVIASFDKNSKIMVENLAKLVSTEHTNFRQRQYVPLALSGLSEDPLNCVRIEALGFLPFLKKCIHSDNPDTAMAAVNCLSNVRKASAAIGQFQECTTQH